MAKDLDTIGYQWAVEQFGNLTNHIQHITPVEFNEQHRFLPESVTSIPGFIRYDVNPYMREILDCCDVNSPVREVSVMKGVQITFTTLLESMLFYYMAHVKTLPMMYVTADKELADARIENNILPMLQQSGFGDIIRSSDVGNTRKTGKTKHHLQFEGGGYLVPFGAKTADKMRQFSICIMTKDEIDAWPNTVGKDGDPDELTDARTSGYTDRAKIFRGSTPLIDVTSKIFHNYNRGDQRKYKVLCKSCSFPQELRWETLNKENGIIGGFQWDFDDGVLITESVRYCCQNCGHEHLEHDKEMLYSPDYGAAWHPTAKPVERNIRSYHLPGFYSPIGMLPWWKNVIQYLDCYDPIAKKVKNMGKYQTFYNNVLGMPFKMVGAKVSFVAVSAHRRAVYKLGQIPNQYAAQHSGSPILFLNCQVDVHKSNLAVTVFGWTRGQRCYVIDYFRMKDEDCTKTESPVWSQLRTLIEEKVYTADDGKTYRIIQTFVDAGYENALVVSFCGEYSSGVYPILGRPRPEKYRKVMEFAEFQTKVMTTGFLITVDHYKDRLSSVLRREWDEQNIEQSDYHFNAPIDLTDKALKELTVETRQEKTDPNGNISYVWYRPSGANNELWDNLIYGHAGVEILAYQICVDHFELETINWNQFWDYIEQHKLYYTE